MSSAAQPRVGLDAAFANVTASGIKYVVLDGWEELPFGTASDIRILTTDQEAVARLMGLLVVDLKRCQFRLEDHPGIIFIYQKGHGLLPERFESEMLVGAVTKDHCLKHPDLDRNFWYTLYKLLYLTAPEDGIKSYRSRLVLDQVLKERVGMPSRPTKFGLKFYPVTPQRG